ncbi:alpha-mannosidase [Halanaerobium saccharolyticum]|uniref:Alpha-mannosidase n=1 Tax=Halanaerobium saccharolyticum TaxID=43595 RepID=A0A4R7Z160_9FIRM|nr:alpha-mannosidase [Halanaerobium saccharolyticum]RAK07839.1 alpha-mannosidase [Halanaerobium saccharolyticum]TDW04453.1 alpha-mannosidase [Halanaerobium saccharolyticum]TDX59789.1 alpha-mannosidase [Halanaerobium saccharolyticum]
MPDSYDLILRKIKGSIYDLAINLDHWDKQEIEYLAPNEYEKIGKKEIINLGDEWDNSGKNFYFSKEVNLPKSMRRKKVFLEFDIGGESAIYVNGKLKRGLNEELILLSKQAKKSYFLQIEATYHIHDYNRHQRKTGEKYYRHYFKKARVVLINEAVKKYYYLLKNTIDSYRFIKDDNYKYLLAQAIENSIMAVDFHVNERKNYLKMIQKADHILNKNLSQIKTSYPGKVYFTANSHLDLAFKWPIKETIRKCKRTFSTAVELMDQYDDLFFVQSQPLLYSFAKDYYPELFEKIKARVKEGRWELIGGMWVEADANLPSGESFVRQLLYGQKFYQTEFDQIPKICWLPDTFGFTTSLPQILKKSGINYFATAKIRQNTVNEFPYNAFKWEGLDGSQVLAYFSTQSSTADIEAEKIYQSWHNLKEKNEIKKSYYAYGYGDGGGGATSEMMENLSAIRKNPILPEVETGKLESDINNLDAVADRLPLWNGEIYFERHRGTYTSQALIKKYNRRLEYLYREAELISSLAELLGAEIDLSNLESGWKKLLANQFHDILPGSCIKEAVSDAYQYYQEAEKIVEEVIEASYNYLICHSGSEEAENDLFVFNPFSYSRSDLIEFNLTEVQMRKDFDALKSELGEIVEVQKDGNKYYFKDTVPALGYKKYKFVKVDIQNEIEDPRKEFVLENEFLKVVINGEGNLAGIYDKRFKREILAAKEANLFELFKETPCYYDAWDLNIKESDKVIINNLEEIKYQVQGPVYDSILIKKRYQETVIEQEIILAKKSSRIDFKTKVNWQERQKLLKVSFPLALNTNKANYDIAFGNLERSTTNNTKWEQAQFEVPAHKWADLSEYNYGVSLLNDCKYGYDIKNNIMRLTLLKGGIYPDPEADLGKHKFVYSLYLHQGDFRKGKTIEEATNINTPLKARVIENRISNQLAGNSTLIKIKGDNLILSAFKKSEFDQDYILRVYDSYGQRNKSTVSFFKELWQVKEVNLMERDMKTDNEIIIKDSKSFTFEIKPYEIKTFKISFKK